jgi:hypothetical protein
MIMEDHGVPEDSYVSHCQAETYESEIELLKAEVEQLRAKSIADICANCTGDNCDDCMPSGFVDKV